MLWSNAGRTHRANGFASTRETTEGKAAPNCVAAKAGAARVRREAIAMSFSCRLRVLVFFGLGLCALTAWTACLADALPAPAKAAASPQAIGSQPVMITIP